MSEFYKTLRAIRNEVGLSQKDFAAKIGMKPVAYNMVESGKNQPSYTLLENIVNVFGLDAKRLFNSTTDGDLTANLKTTGNVIQDETEYLNQVHDYRKRIYDLYQRIVDVRVLLFQELKVRGQFATNAEVDLLNSLTRPAYTEVDNENLFSWPYENLNEKEKREYLQKLDACVTLFTNTFFDCFMQLYQGIYIPADKDFRKKRLAEREKLTNKWTYTHV